MYILGDFNINLINASSHTPTSSFLDIMYANFLFPVINRPTRITTESATLIDNIFTNDINNFTHLNGILVSDITDHYPIFTIVTNKCTKTDIGLSIKTRNINPQSIEYFKAKLNEIDWNIVLSMLDAKESFDKFYQVYTTKYNECFPIITKKIGYTTRKPWITFGIKESIKTKNNLYLIQKKNPSIFNIKTYKKYKVNLRKILKKCEREHFNGLIEKYKSNTKQTWNTIKSIINKNKYTGFKSINIKVGSTITSNKTAIAEHFNKFFVNVGSNLAKTICNTNEDPLTFVKENINSIYLSEVNEAEVQRIIMNFKNSSPGPDGQNVKVLKQTYYIYLKPMVHMLNLSLQQGYFPNMLKLAKVIPVFKGGNATECKNYRPISVLNTFSKLYEKIMYNRIVDFLNANNTLYNLQFGFRAKYNTSFALAYLIDKIMTSIEKKEYVIGLFVDLSKAFDTVNHSILLAKIFKYGIRGMAYTWINNYLTDRKQYVTFNNTESSVSKIICGVPQGSILGPLLFLIYINDMMNISDKLIPLLYADDTNFFYSGKDIPELINTLNTELRKFTMWTNVNKLTVNEDKTQYIIFRAPKAKLPIPLPGIYLNCKLITKVESTKFLGIVLDECLNWTKHINYIKNKIAKNIGIICKARQVFESSTLLKLNYSFVYPYLIYCIESWGHACKTHLDCLLKLQKRILRIIMSLSHRHPTSPIFINLKILNIYEIIFFYTAVFIFKFKKGLLPSIFCDFFSYCNNPYNTRQQNHFSLPRMRTEFSKRRIRYTGVKLHNLLLILNWNCSLHTFKYALRNHLLLNSIIL